MKPRLYVETTIFSYATARPSRDLVTAAHQQVTRDWWTDSRGGFELYISQLVVGEIGSGDPAAAAERLRLSDGLPLLDATPQAIDLARALMDEGPLPAGEPEDALHIALAAVHGMEFLLTWNCRHIANARMRGAVERTCQRHGHEAPSICTPEELMGDEHGQ